MNIEDFRKHCPDLFKPVDQTEGKTHAGDLRGSYTLDDAVDSGKGFELIPIEKNLPKKLILTDWTLKYLSDQHHFPYQNNVAEMLKALLAVGIEIEYVTAGGTLEILTQDNIESAMAAIAPLSDEKVYELAAQQKGYARADLCILNPQCVSSLQEALLGKMFNYSDKDLTYFDNFQFPYHLWQEKVPEDEKVQALNCPPVEWGLALHVDQNRVARGSYDLQSISDELISKFENDPNLLRVFKHVKCLGVHNENFPIFGDELVGFREFINASMPNIITYKGQLFVGEITAAPLDSLPIKNIVFQGASWFSAVRKHDVKLKQMDRIECERVKVNFVPNTEKFIANELKFDDVTTVSECDRLKYLKMGVPGDLAAEKSESWIAVTMDILKKSPNLSVFNLKVECNDSQSRVKVAWIFFLNKSVFPSVEYVSLDIPELHLLALIAGQETQQDEKQGWKIILSNLLKKFPNIKGLTLTAMHDPQYESIVEEIMADAKILVPNVKLAINSKDLADYEIKAEGLSGTLNQSALEENAVYYNFEMAPWGQSVPTRATVIASAEQDLAALSQYQDEDNVALDAPSPHDTMTLRDAGAHVTFSVRGLFDYSKIRRAAFKYDAGDSRLKLIKPNDLEPVNLEIEFASKPEVEPPSIAMGFAGIKAGQRIRLANAHPEDILVKASVNNEAAVQHLQLLHSKEDGFYYLTAIQDIDMPFAIDYQLELHGNEARQTKQAIPADIKDAIARYKDFRAPYPDETFSKEPEELAEYLTNNKVGACRHVAFLFAREFSEKYPVKVIHSAVHEWVEVQLEGKWVEIDLGGKEYSHIDDKREKPDVPKLVEPVKAAPVAEQKPTELIKIMPDVNEAIAQKQRITIKPQNVSDTPLLIENIMTQHKGKVRYFNGLKELLTSEVCLEEGQLAKRKDDSQYDVIVIDLASMNAKDAGNINRFLDSRECQRLAKLENTAIVWILGPELQKETSFDTRMKKTFTLMPRELQGKASSPIQAATADEEISVDLYGLNTDWRRRLLGGLVVRDGVKVYEKGALEEAAEKGKTLHIVNPPQSDAFKRTLLAIQASGSFRTTGRTVQLPEGFQIQQSRDTLDLSRVAFVPVTDEVLPAFDYIYNAETASHFIQTYKVIDGLPSFLPGWKETKPLTILATEPISEQFLSILSKHQHITVIEAYKAKQSVQSKVAEQYTSTDVEDAVDELLQKHPKAEVIHLHAAGYAELMFHADLDAGGVNLHYTPQVGYMVEQLTSKDMAADIILTGDFSEDFVKQMQSLLHSDKPYLYVNGEKVDVNPNAKLRFVSQKAPMPFLKSEAVPLHPEKVTGLLQTESLKQSYEALQNAGITLSLQQAKRIASVYQKFPDKNPFASVLMAHKEYQKILKLTEAQFTAPPAQADTLEEEAQRRVDEVLQLLEVEKTVGAAGPTGTGKTTTLLDAFGKDENGKDKHPRVRLFVGEAEHAAFLQACAEENAQPKHEQKLCVMFEDEANVVDGASANPMERYQNIQQANPSELYEGKRHELGDVGRVLVACNPASYGNRVSTGVFEHIPYVMFDRFNDAILQNEIEKYLKTFGFEGDKTEAAKVILALYHKTQDRLDKSKSPQAVSLRNLKNACARVAVLEQDAKNAKADVNLSPEKICKLGAYREFKQLFQGKDAAETKKQQSALRETLGIKGDAQWRKFKIIKAGEPKNAGLYNTKSARVIRYQLHEYFQMRARLLASGETFTLPSLLFQGPSGIGKTEVMLDYLKHHQPDQFVQLPAGTEAEMEAFLIKHVLQEGKIVLVDELNTLPLEKCLNAVLSGKDMNGLAATVQGGGVVSSQNPPSYAYRLAQTTAFLNRFSVTRLDEPKREELIAIIKRYGKTEEEANTLYAQYEADKRSGKPVNLRSLTNQLEAERAGDLTLKEGRPQLKMESAPVKAKDLSDAVGQGMKKR